MYRDDQEALALRAEAATREADQLRRENEAMRLAVTTTIGNHLPVTPAFPPSAVYTALDLRTLPMEERARLAAHSVTRFPVWLVAILNVITLGLFPLIHFGLQNDKLPRAASNDPSSGKAIGFAFIPYFNLYWIFFSALRLCDRITLQFRVRGIRDVAPRGLVLSACILTVIPYINMVIGIPILWTIAVCFLQASLNRVAALSPTSWDATTIGPVAPPPPVYRMAPPSPEQLAVQARARKLVNLSHWLGWGGLGMLVIGTPFVFGLAGGIAGGTFATISGISLVSGAVIGQVGRGMQGRVI